MRHFAAGNARMTELTTALPRAVYRVMHIATTVSPVLKASSPHHCQWSNRQVCSSASKVIIFRAIDIADVQ